MMVISGAVYYMFHDYRSGAMVKPACASHADRRSAAMLSTPPNVLDHRPSLEILI